MGLLGAESWLGWHGGIGRVGRGAAGLHTYSGGLIDSQLLLSNNQENKTL